MLLYDYAYYLETQKAFDVVDLQYTHLWIHHQTFANILKRRTKDIRYQKCFRKAHTSENNQSCNYVDQNYSMVEVNNRQRNITTKYKLANCDNAIERKKVIYNQKYADHGRECCVGVTC